jgi:hypothetical protein
MSKLVLLWLTLLVGIFFLALPYSEELHDYFPLSDQLLTLQTHTWFICNRLIFVVFAWIILQESSIYRNALWVFFGIQVLKLVDYLVCYNEVWVYVWPNVPFSSNTLSILVFSLFIAYEAIWRKQL